jgi:hypothetical protein
MRGLARSFGGLGLGVVVFFAFIGIWQTTYAGVPITVGARAHSVENMSIMKGVFRKEEDKARKKAEKDPDLPGIHRLLASGLGWHNTNILERYMGQRKAVWGILALCFVLLVPAARPRGAESPANPSRPSLAVGGEPRSQWLDARVFLLLFALLPLVEFALLPVLMRDDGLGIRDIRDGDRLIERFRAEGPENAPPLRRRLSAGSRRLLSQHEFAGPWSDRLLDALLTDLNRVIEGPPLDIGAEEWSGVAFRGKTRELHSSSLEEDDRQYFNRLVIEDVFPEALARRDILGIRFRTFTGRTYRYLLMPAFGLSLAMAIAVGMLVDLLTGLLARLDPGTAASQRREQREGSRAVRWPGRVRSTLMVLTFALLCSQLLHAKGYGNWPPTSKPSEERALEWMIENLPDDARIVCNWFNADFVRSYSARAGRPMSSVFAGTANRPGVRLNVRAAVEPAGLDIPELTSTDEILAYAEQNPGSYYVMKTRFGPWLPVQDDPQSFRLIATFPGDREEIETVRIFELTRNPVRVEPKE